MSSILTIPTSFYSAAAPLLILAVGGMLSLLQGVNKTLNTEKFVKLTFFGSLIAALLASCFIDLPEKSFLGGALALENLTIFGQRILLVMAIATGLIFHENVHSKKFFTGEISFLFQMIVLGLLLMISSQDFVTIFVGLELSSIGLYSLVGYLNPTRKSQEGAIKYFILGSFSAALFLFGIALLYASTGALQVSSMSIQNIHEGLQTWAQVGAVFVLCSLTFKLAFVPFHAWAPDVYESAPTPLTAFMAMSMKVAVLMLIVRLLPIFNILGEGWITLFSILTFFSILYGNILALSQNSVKRMLAYSSIAHSGYMGLSMIHLLQGGSSLPLKSILFYVIGYALALILSFTVLSSLETEKNQNIMLDDLRGLGKKHPWLAACLSLALFSMAGLPPTVGFINKFYIFYSAMSQGNMISLVIVAALASTVALFYYLRVIVRMYMQKEGELEPLGSECMCNASLICLLGFTALAILMLGSIFPQCTLQALELTLQP